MSLTEVGQQMTAVARAMLEMTEQDICSAKGTPRGILRINAPTSFGIRHLGELISDFLALHPDIRVELSLDDRVVDIVEHGFDLAIRIRRLEDSSLTTRYLAPARMVLCASPDYLARHGPSAHPGELEEPSCIWRGMESGPSSAPNCCRSCRIGASLCPPSMR